MPGSVGSSNWSYSRRSTPDGGPKFDPFIVLDIHPDHMRATSIVRLPDSDKVFCPICLEMRSADDIGGMPVDSYNRYLGDLFDILDKYGEDENLRKIVLTILEVFLSKRIFVLERDDQFHRILRVLYRLMKSDLYNQTEFVILTKIMAGISIEQLQPIPLRSAWEAWRNMLDYGQSFSVGALIDHDSQNIPKKWTEFLIGQAITVRTYIGLVNHIAKDKISDLIFSTHRHKQEPLTSKYYETSQTICLKFIEEKLFPNCNCFLSRESALSPLELQVISEVFGALRECFINAETRNDTQSLSWLKQKDIIRIAHHILSKNPSPEYHAGIYVFLKTFAQYHINSEYGVEKELTALINEVGTIDTVANRVTRLCVDGENSKLCIFYLLLNWLAIKLESRYYKADRVGRVLRDPQYLDAIKGDLRSSHCLRRVFAFVVAKSIQPESNHSAILRILKEDWREIYNGKKLTEFRQTYCYEVDIFEWSWRHKEFTKLMNGNAIEYLIDRGIARNNLVNTLKILMGASLRQTFCRYIKRAARSLFEKIIPLGANAIDRSIMSDFSSWLPALVQEVILRLKTNLEPDKKLTVAASLNELLAATNLLLSDSPRSKFSPYFCDQFIIDLTSIIEQAYKSTNRSKLEHEFLLISHELMAQLIETFNPCIMKLIQYIDFTLIGYMYYFVDNYQCGDELGEAIAHVLVAYDNLDTPLEHRLENTLIHMWSNAYEWMMSGNTDLHLISLRLVEKCYPPSDTTTPNRLNLLDTPRACIVTGFIHMLCVNLEMIDDRVLRRRVVSILKYEDFRYHPLYPCLLERAPLLRDEISVDDHQVNGAPPSPDLSFASASDFEEEHISVSRILEQLQEDEGYRSASTISLPKNIYLSRVIEEQTSDYPGTQEWERRAYEQTQSINLGTTNNEESVQT